MQFSFDPKLNSISEKVESGERLTFDEGVALYHTDDLNALGKLADHIRRKKHGNTTYYNVNRHFNHTNICVADCKFCGFYKRARQEGAYTHSIEEGIEIARQAVNEGATELHIVGVKIAFGTDAGVYPHGWNARQFAKMVEWGMTPMAAIQAATVGNADLFGWSDRIGSITPGKFADIIAVDGDPLGNISVLENVGFVMKGGVVYKSKAQK